MSECVCFHLTHFLIDKMGSSYKFQMIFNHQPHPNIEAIKLLQNSNISIEFDLGERGFLSITSIRLLRSPFTIHHSNGVKSIVLGIFFYFAQIESFSSAFIFRLNVAYQSCGLTIAVLCRFTFSYYILLYCFNWIIIELSKWKQRKETNMWHWFWTSAWMASSVFVNFLGKN